jgi:hypothetical protein
MSLRKSSARRNRERGSVLLIAMIALVALVLLGSLTVVTVRSSLSGTTHERFKAVALSAAEAGIAVGIDYARSRYSQLTKWSGLLMVPPAVNRPPDLPGNSALPGQGTNIFSPDAQAWYEVEFVNNADDGTFDPVTRSYTGVRDAIDSDGRIIVRSIGHGPNNAAVRLEVEIMNPAVQFVPCNAGDSTNAGNTNCGQVNGGTTDQVAR